MVFKVEVPIEERFWSKVLKTPTCWLWQGKKFPRTGYGQFTIRRKTVLAHRTAHELAIGPIPAGMLVCHRCDVRDCVRPDHLFLGTYSDNMRDASSKMRLPTQKNTHCLHGHEYTLENTRWYGNIRQCRKCHAERSRKARKAA